MTTAALYAPHDTKEVHHPVPYEFNPDDFLSTVDAARVLGLSPGTLRARRSEGRETLPHIKVGPVVLYYRSAVERSAREGLK
jgi:hypothetical protein